MKSGFLSRASIYQGDYSCILRNPSCEFDADTHYHDFYELQLYISGQTRMLLGDKEYYLHEGDLVFVNMFQPHVTMSKDGSYYERFCVDLDPSFLLTACTEKANLLELFCDVNPNYPIYHLNIEQFSKYLNLSLKFENIQITTGRDIMERAVLYEILANLYSDACSNNNISLAKNQQFVIVADLIRYISDNLSGDLSLEKLSAEVNYSVYYLCRVFKKYTGETLSKYISSKRIEYAKNLLRMNTPIAYACSKAGFNNYSYFYKTFKSVVGMNPAEYQKTLQSKRPPDSQGLTVE